MSTKQAKTIPLQPLADMIIIEPKQSEQTTASGLIIQSAQPEKPNTGTVLAVGPGRIAENGQIIPITIKPGDIVLFKKNDYAAEQINYESRDLYIIKAESVLAIINN